MHIELDQNYGHKFAHRWRNSKFFNSNLNQNLLKLITKIKKVSKAAVWITNPTAIWQSDITGVAQIKSIKEPTKIGNYWQLFFSTGIFGAFGYG